MSDCKTMIKMKKTIFCLFALAAVSAGFSSCEDDINFDRGTHSSRPAAQAAGSYNGTWTVFSSDGTTIEKEGVNGSVEIASADDEIVNVSLVCADVAALNGKSSVANISWANNGFVFSNPLSSNGLATMFMGEVSEQGAMNLKFSMSVRSGRTTVTKFYQFKGNK